MLDNLFILEIESSMNSEKESSLNNEENAVSLDQISIHEEILLNQLADILYHSYMRKVYKHECIVIDLNEMSPLKQVA